MIHLALRVLAALVACLPWRALGVPGAALGLVAGSILRIRRRAVEEAMAEAGVSSPGASAREMYAALGRGLVELLWLAGASARRREKAVGQVRWEGDALGALDAALAEGPVLLAAAHTGNWELVAFAAAAELARRGRRLVVVAKPLSVGGVDRFVRALREAFGVVLVPPRGAARACLDHLAAGDVVVMPIDQVPELEAHAQRTRFLGRPAATDRAPATLAARAGATMLVALARRDGGAQRVAIAASIRPAVVGVSGAVVAADGALEAFVRSAPASWMWLHRRWRAPRARRAPRSTFPARTSA